MTQSSTARYMSSTESSISTTAVEQRARVRLLTWTRNRQEKLFLVAVLFTDIVALLVSFGIAYEMRFQTDLPFFDDGNSSPVLLLSLIAVILPVWLVVFALFRLYDIQYLLGGTEEYSRIFNASAIVLAVVIIVTFLVPVVRISRGWITITVVTAWFLLISSRFTLRRVAYRLRKRGILTSRTLIIGTNEEAHAIAQQFEAAPTAGAEVVGFVDDKLPIGTRIANRHSVVATLDMLPSIVKKLNVAQLIVSTSALSRDDLIRVFLMFGQSNDVELRLSSGLFEIFTTGVHVKEIGSVPLVSIKKFRLNEVETALKTLTDYAITIVAMLLLSPFLLLIALLIKWDSPGPVLYRRTVLGRGDRVFGAYKFRTMYIHGEEILSRYPALQLELSQNHKLKADPRVTRVGRFLRRYSLDELPQLINVLRGEMSLVGPRIITPNEADMYGKWRMNLLTVKPGLTGLWQVKGRSDLTYEERVRLDMYYIRNYSIWLDLQILMETVPAVLRARGAY